MSAAVQARVTAALGLPAGPLSPLGGGCVGDVFRTDLAGGRTVVVKAGDPGSALDVEGYMLAALGQRSRLPVPGVLHAEDTLLVMDWIPNRGGLSTESQIHAADLLADLHAVTAPLFGLERDTLIGGLHQPNPPTPRWLDFFRDQRLLDMGRRALEAGRLPAPFMGRLEALAGRLDRYITEPARPSLIHGDMWTGNVLCDGPRIAGFIDPAIYFADPEIELAFSTMFGTFGRAFFQRYNEHRPIAPDFFEVRRDLYNLYPLLVHVRLFGGSYVGSVDATLNRFGV